MLTLQIIADILQKGLGLSEQRIWIYNQRREIPADTGLFIVVGQLGRKPYASIRKSEYTISGLSEKLAQSFQEQIFIEAFSADTSALERLPQIVGCLNSTYSEQRQEYYGMKIAAIPATINDISSLEGTAILYRFNMTFNVLRTYESIAPIDYYDSYQHEIYNEEGKVT
jgi:hypothetical protein